MNFSLYISRRLQLSANGKNGRSAGVVIAIAGVSIAIAVMIITLATVLGFKNAIEKKDLILKSRLKPSDIAAMQLR